MADKDKLPIGSDSSDKMNDAVQPNHDLSGNESSHDVGGKGKNDSGVKDFDKSHGDNRLASSDQDFGKNSSDGLSNNDIVSNNMDLSGGGNSDPEFDKLSLNKSDPKSDGRLDADASDFKSKFSDGLGKLGNVDFGELGNNLKDIASKPRQSYVKFTDKASDDIESMTKNSKIKVNKTVAKHAINIMVSSMLGFGGFGVWSMIVHHKKVVDDDGVCLTQNVGNISYSGVLSTAQGYDGEAWLQDGTEQNNNAKAVIKLLKELGFSGPGIAGVLGNMRAESSFNTGILNKNGNNGKGDGGKGLMQWTNNPPKYTEGRRNELEATAKSMGKDSGDLEVQIAQIRKDLTNPSMWVSAYKSPFNPKTYNASSSPAEAGYWFYLSQFEAGGAFSYDKDHSGDNRKAYSQQAYSHFNLSNIKANNSKLDSLLGGENQDVANVNSAMAETVNALLCNTGSSNADTSSIVSTAKSLTGYFSYDQRTRTNFVKSGKYSDIKNISNVKKDGNADCSSYVWLVLKLAGYKVPEQCWATPFMESDAKGDQTYLKKIDSKDAKAGDIVVVNLNGGNGSNGHTAILLEDWHGEDTKVINEGGSQPNGSVHEGTFSGEFYPSLRGGTVTFARATK